MRAGTLLHRYPLDSLPQARNDLASEAEFGIGIACLGMSGLGRSALLCERGKVDG